MPEIRPSRESEEHPVYNRKDEMQRHFEEGMKAIPTKGHTSSDKWGTEKMRQNIISDLSDVLAKHQRGQERKHPQAPLDETPHSHSSSIAEIGDSLLRNQRNTLDSILPAPKGGDSIQAFPYIGELPAANLPAVSQELSHSSAIEILVSDPVGWKSRIDTCRQSIQHSAQSLDVEYDFSTQCIQSGLQEVSHYLNFLAQGGASLEIARERYQSIDSSLNTIRTGVNMSGDNEIKTTTNAFLHTIGIGVEN